MGKYDHIFKSIRRKDRPAIAGFVAAKNGIAKSENPHLRLFKTTFNSWNYGWECWHRRILPWELWKVISGISGTLMLPDINLNFYVTEKLPPEVEQILSDYPY